MNDRQATAAGRPETPSGPGRPLSPELERIAQAHAAWIARTASITQEGLFRIEQCHVALPKQPGEPRGMGTHETPTRGAHRRVSE